jgi:hypothetical protein
MEVISHSDTETYISVQMQYIWTRSFQEVRNSWQLLYVIHDLFPSTVYKAKCCTCTSVSCIQPNFDTVLSIFRTQSTAIENIGELEQLFV